MGVCKIVAEISEGLGGGGYFSGQKMEIPGRRGSLHEIPSVVGVWIFSGTTHWLQTHIMKGTICMCLKAQVSDLMCCFPINFHNTQNDKLACHPVTANILPPALPGKHRTVNMPKPFSIFKHFAPHMNRIKIMAKVLLGF